MRVILKDFHKGIIDARIKKELDSEVYEIIRIRGLIENKEKVTLEKLHYHDLEQMYLCYTND